MYTYTHAPSSNTNQKTNKQNETHSKFAYKVLGARLYYLLLYWIIIVSISNNIRFNQLPSHVTGTVFVSSIRLHVFASMRVWHIHTHTISCDNLQRWQHNVEFIYESNAPMSGVCHKNNEWSSVCAAETLLGLVALPAHLPDVINKCKRDANQRLFVLACASLLPSRTHTHTRSHREKPRNTQIVLIWSIDRLFSVINRDSIAESTFDGIHNRLTVYQQALMRT